MIVNDASLLAYVDGELPPFECANIEKAMRLSADTAVCVLMLRASQLPYAAAFSRQALPPVPDTLKRQVELLVRLELPGTGAPGETAKEPPRRQAHIPLSATRRNDPLHDRSRREASRMQIPPRRLSSAFAAATLCLGVVLCLVSSLLGDPFAFTIASSPRVSPWIVAAAGYQALYTRETLTQLEPDTAATAETVNNIRNEDKLSLQIPDLRLAGLTFKRVQRLRFHDKPLVQILYLPVKGGPVALCVLKEAKADVTPSSERVNEMDVVSWRREQLGYALIGEHGNVDLYELGKKIYNGSVPASISQNGTGTATPQTPDKSDGFAGSVTLLAWRGPDRTTALLWHLPVDVFRQDRSSFFVTTVL